MSNRNYHFPSELSLQNKGCNIVTTSWCNDKKLIVFARNLQETNKGIPKYPFSVTPMGFKPMTSGTGILRSIQLSYGANKLIAKMQPTSAKKVYFQFAECSYILCKGIASECKESLLSVCRAQLYLMQRYSKVCNWQNLPSTKYCTKRM